MNKELEQQVERLYEESLKKFSLSPEEKKKVDFFFEKEVKRLKPEREKNTLTLPKLALGVNHLSGFVVGEYRFAKKYSKFSGKRPTEEEILRIISQKYLTFRHTLEKEKDEGREIFDPVVSTISRADTFFEQINEPRSHRNPSVSLINDIFETIFKKINGFAKRMALALYTDALSNWRTVHESECILSLLVNGNEKVRQNYVKHINYSMVFRNNDNEVFPKEYVDQVFEQIKAERKTYNLKSKDRKKYIDYGWIYSLDQYDPNDNKIRLNFRFGVEYLAGLIDHSDRYEVASERDHASASFFFYSNDETCRKLALLNFYDSMNRIIALYRKYRKVYFDNNPEKKKDALVRQDMVKTRYDYISQGDNRKELFYDQKDGENNLSGD